MQTLGHSDHRREDKLGDILQISCVISPYPDRRCYLIGDVELCICKAGFKMIAWTEARRIRSTGKQKRGSNAGPCAAVIKSQQNYRTRLKAAELPHFYETFQNVSVGCTFSFAVFSAVNITIIECLLFGDLSLCELIKAFQRYISGGCK